MTETFAALGDPNRFRIVELLRGGAKPVNEISNRLSLSQPQVSKALSVLKTAGLVDAKRRAQQRLYAIRPKPLREVHQWLERYRQIWDARFDALDRVLVEQEAEPYTTTPLPTLIMRANSGTKPAHESKEAPHARKSRNPR